MLKNLLTTIFGTAFLVGSFEAAQALEPFEEAEGQETSPRAQGAINTHQGITAHYLDRMGIYYLTDPLGNVIGDPSGNVAFDSLGRPVPVSTRWDNVSLLSPLDGIKPENKLQSRM